MPLTTALYTGLSGLTVNQVALDVIGNNIANVNTYAFKSSRALFEPQFSETWNFGTSPGEVSGGTNPLQKGLGVTVGTIQRDFAQGNTKPTKRGDLAIEGQGMFIVDGVERGYTRNGAFQLNAQDCLTTTDGMYVMGYGVDSEFNLVSGRLDQLTVPLGDLTIAEPTSNVHLAGTLWTDGDLATAGTILQSQAIKLNDGGLGGPVLDTTLLVDLLNTDDEQMFFDGDTVTFQGRRGDALAAQRELAVTATATLGDLMNMMVDSLGINTDPTIPDPGGAALVDLGGGLWAWQITGNVGTANALAIGTGDLSSDSATGPGMPTFSVEQEAAGESVSTTQTVYDSLGNRMTLSLTYVYESRDNSGTTWRFFATSPDDTDQSSVVGTGTASFDNYGAFVSSTGATATIDRMGTGSVTPLAIALRMEELQALNNKFSQLQVEFLDGKEAGTLYDYSVGQDGVITGAFTNGLTRTLGQVALATFSNYLGLIDNGSNVFRPGSNSGEPVITTPMYFGAGKIVDGALETSNVDISNEFINLITTSAGFSASSRIITTANQLLTELLSIMR